jgi:hypothetical protein
MDMKYEHAPGSNFGWFAGSTQSQVKIAQDRVVTI